VVALVLIDQDVDAGSWTTVATTVLLVLISSPWASSALPASASNSIKRNDFALTGARECPPDRADRSTGGP
jgi:hypothetical protein